MGTDHAAAAGDWTLDSSLRQDDVANVAGWMADRRIAHVLGLTRDALDAREAAEYMQGFGLIGPAMHRRTTGPAGGRAVAA